MEQQPESDSADKGSEAFSRHATTDEASKSLAQQLRDIGKQCAELPDVETRSPEEIVGYDDKGMW